MNIITIYYNTFQHQKKIENIITTYLNYNTYN
jgi:hypothetical protein